MTKLSKLEKQMVIDAIEFVKAGEWPWELEDSRREAREIAALDRALSKLRGERR